MFEIGLLFRAHIDWSPDQLFEPRHQGLAGQPLPDGFGDTATGEVVVSVTTGDAGSQNMFTPLYGPGSCQVRFAGIVGRTYSVQRALVVTGPWTTIGSATVGPTGIVSFEDTDPPPSSAFYRTSYP